MDFPDGCTQQVHDSTPRIKLLTQTLVGGIPSGPGPRSVLVKGVTSLAVGSLCVMLAVTHQATLFTLNTLAGMAVALTSKGKYKHTVFLNLQVQSFVSSPHFFIYPTVNKCAHSGWGRRRKKVRGYFHHKELSLRIISHRHKDGLR